MFMWVYASSSEGWNVGYIAGSTHYWISKWDSEKAAMQAVHYLNGGSGKMPSDVKQIKD